MENNRQHVVPQGYTYLFSQDGRHVFVRNRGDDRVYSTSPVNVAVEKECYSILDEGRRELAADEVNKAIEGHFPPLIRALNPKASISTEQRHAVWFLTSNLLTRSRRTRDALNAILSQSQKVAVRIIEKFQNS